MYEYVCFVLYRIIVKRILLWVLPFVFNQPLFKKQKKAKWLATWGIKLEGCLGSVSYLLAMGHSWYNTFDKVYHCTIVHGNEVLLSPTEV